MPASIVAVNQADADRVERPTKMTKDAAGSVMPHVVVDSGVDIAAAIVLSVAVGAVSAASGAAVGKTDVILISSTDCFVKAAATPTAAAATSYPLKAFTPMRVKLALTDKIAVIRSAADGVLNIFDPA
jgi:hypothetical protein